MTRNCFQALLAAAVVPTVLVGQTPRPSTAPRAESQVFTFAGNRARIGVLVSVAADSATDRYGAKLDAVTPGGPADRAGLKAGDIITRFNGTSLAGVRSRDRGESGPGNKLVELVGQLDPGDSVQVEYRRDGATKRVSLVTEERNGWAVLSGPDVSSFGGTLERAPMAAITAGPGGAFSVCFGDAWCDLDLVTLNPDLGEYFGTHDGILVVKAPGDSALPLKGGDVILSIGGRKPMSPSHAMRILRSYEAGENVTIDIMRKQRRTTLTWKVPEPRSRLYRVGPHGQPSLWRPEEDAQRALRATMERMRESQRLLQEKVKRSQALRERELRDAQRELERSLQERDHVLRKLIQARRGESVAT